MLRCFAPACPLSPCSCFAAAGITCGFIGQGVANSLMMLKRHYKGASEHDVAVPPLVRTALVWGMFMVSSTSSSSREEQQQHR